MEWFNRMKAALDLMEENMEGRLDIEEIAKAAYSSPFHFQRMFQMLTGMTVAEYMRKRKLTLAAQELALSSSKVIDISLKYGYESPEAFAKAFRKVHGISPSEARSPGVSLKAFPRISFHLSLKGDKDMDYRIVEQDTFKVVGKAIRTTCQDNQQTRDIPALWGACHQDGTVAKLASIGKDNKVLGIMLDMQTGKDEFTYMITSQTEADAASIAEGLASATIPASTWVVFTALGPAPATIQNLFCRIYQEWFPATGYEHSGGPEMEVYLPGDVTAEDYRCEIWIPIVKK